MVQPDLRRDGLRASSCAPLGFLAGGVGDNAVPSLSLGLEKSLVGGVNQLPGAAEGVRAILHGISNRDRHREIGVREGAGEFCADGVSDSFTNGGGLCVAAAE